MPKPNRQTCVAFWSPPELTAKLDAAARAEGISRADLVRRSAIASVSKPHDVPLPGENLLAAIAAHVVAGGAEKADMREIKYLGAAFLAKVNTLGTGRELSIAKTKIEEAVMWAVKHITN